jgi:hypothetical protein
MKKHEPRAEVICSVCGRRLDAKGVTGPGGKPRGWAVRHHKDPTDGRGCRGFECTNHKRVETTTTGFPARKRDHDWPTKN